MRFDRSWFNADECDWMKWKSSPGIIVTPCGLLFFFFFSCSGRKIKKYERYPWQGSSSTTAANVQPMWYIMPAVSGIYYWNNTETLSSTLKGIFRLRNLPSSYFTSLLCRTWSSNYFWIFLPSVKFSLVCLFGFLLGCNYQLFLLLISLFGSYGAFTVTEEERNQVNIHL